MNITSAVVPFLSGALLSLLPSIASAQTTWYVDVNAAPPGSGTLANPYASIQYAITRNTTVTGDTILVAPGLYVENVADYPKRVTVRASAGPLLTELRPQNPLVATAYLDQGSTIEGFTLTGNSSSGLNGGALNLESSIAIRCIVRDNPTMGVFSYNASLRHCTIVDNGTGIAVEFFAGVDLSNTIVWSSSGSDLLASAFPPAANYSAGGLLATTVGVGNIIGAPGVWEIDGSRYRLRPGSPCIDAGDPNSPLDPDGTRADIGAVPYDANFAPAPASYCVGKLNGQGCVPAIGAIGTASASSPAPFTITAANEVDNKAGLMFFGFGKRAVPFQGGTYCVELPIKRVGAQNSAGSGACGGAFAFDMRTYIQSGVHPGLVPGAIVYCQWWNRDPLDPAGFSSGLSNAMSFGIAP